MTAFQKKTLKNSITILFKALAIGVALIGITLFVIWQPYITISLIVVAIIVYALIIPTIKDWKLRGKLTEDEYGIYVYYRDHEYLNEESIVAELARWNDGFSVEQLKEIIVKAEEK